MEALHPTQSLFVDLNSRKFQKEQVLTLIMYSLRLTLQFALLMHVITAELWTMKPYNPHVVIQMSLRI